MTGNKKDYGSAYLYAEDLLSGGEYRTISVEIAEVIQPNTQTAANGKRIDKYILRFKGKEKLLVLCKTNAAMIRYATGDALENSVGKSITLQPRIVSAFGDEVVAIRVLPPPGMKIRRSLNQRLGTKAVWGKQEDTNQ